MTFCSSVFLGTLISMQQAIVADGGEFRVSAVSPVVARVLEITGMAAALGAPGYGRDGSISNHTVLPRPSCTCTPHLDAR